MRQMASRVHLRLLGSGWTLYQLGRIVLDAKRHNVLLKRDFEVSKGETLYRVEAVAVFETHGFNLTEVGAGQLFDSGFVRTHIQTWIHLGL